MALPVRLPPDQVRQDSSGPQLFLVVPTYHFLRNGKPDRWLLLICGLWGQHVGLRQIRYDYALRWRAEDAKRFMGQIWHVERFLTGSFPALERLLWCVCLVGGLLAWLQREEPVLARQLQQEVLYHQKTFKLPGYPLARGLQGLARRQLDHLTVLQNA